MLEMNNCIHSIAEEIIYIKNILTNYVVWLGVNTQFASRLKPPAGSCPPYRFYS